MGRRFFAPEVIQTSSIDCGPACLLAALQGYGIQASYERLRDACQTDVDGTSINAMEVVANQLGLVARQIWIPADHILTPEVAPLPAVVIVRSPNGVSHFILLWRRVGPFYQIMDPSTGRRWITGRQLTAILFELELRFESKVWREWAGNSEFEWLLRKRLRALEADDGLFERAVEDPSSISLASLDAVARFVSALAEADGLRIGPETQQLVASLFERVVSETRSGAAQRTVPDDFYCAYPVAGSSDEILLRGTVLIRLRGARATDKARPTSNGLEPKTVDEVQKASTLPWRELFRVMLRDGTLPPTMVGLAALVTTVLIVGEALLLRAFLELGTRLQVATQRIAACALLLLFLLIVTALESWSASAVRAVGRRIELRLRADLFLRIPRLQDVYFRSRPPADMAHRAHLFHPVRDVAAVAVRILRVCVELVVVVFGLVWLDPSSLWLTLLATTVCVTVPLLGQRMLIERDWKVRTYDGTMVQFYLDALLGLIPVRAHGAERALRWEHGSVLLEWARACKQRLRVSVSVELIQSLFTVALAMLIVVHAARGPWQSGATLLFAYWALNLPWLGQELAFIGRTLPRYRTLVSRLLEPLSGGVDQLDGAGAAGIEGGAGPLSIEFDDVGVKSSGKALLQSINLSFAAGEHVAVVGPSGAGKSTLVALLLGLRQSDGGRLLIAGRPLDGSQLAWLRTRIAWVDPAVSLWNRSLLDNITYGARAADLALESILEESDLVEVLERLPHGLRSELGESGRLLSGGEGQRVRLARALTRAEAGLVLLDEPFRGLELERRTRLLQSARTLWRGATLVCVTHDLAASSGFDRVVVVENGKVREHGPPAALLAQPGSRYAELMHAESTVRRSVWDCSDWRRLRVEDGRLTESSAHE